MDVLLTGAQAKEADHFTIQEIGIPSPVLMERAAMAVAEKVVQAFPDAEGVKVLSICGYGNNGGDGVAAARLLLMKGYRAEVFLNGDSSHITEECARQIGIYRKLGGRFCEDAETGIAGCTVLIDALTGVGLKGCVRQEAAALIDLMNRSNAYIVAVDIPSGVIADNGRVPGTAVQADETVTFSYYKRGHVQYPGRSFCGRITMADVGIMQPDRGEKPAFALTDEAAAKLLPPRYPRSNKGTYGKALLVCGRKNMAGAAVMAMRAAVRSGAGLVTGISDGSNRTIIQSSVPEAIYASWQDAEAEKRILHWGTAAGCGCGLGTDSDAKHMLETVLASDAKTVVLDADALNVIAQGSEWPAHEGKTVIITPHPGEMARLCGMKIREILDDPAACAVRYAKDNHVIVVLKDAATVITDGERVCINRTGCPGMSTGGSGDVLTGLLTGLCAQGVKPFEAAALAVYVHGRAGQLAQEKAGAYAMTATDIADMIGSAYASLTGEELK